MTGPTSTWSIFCAVVDNYGDLGVCLRLARQLHAEYAAEITLWVDDPAAVESFLGLQWCGKDEGRPWKYEGIHLRLWRRPWQAQPETADLVAHSDVVVEAFGADIPRQVVTAMARREHPPLWVNLEYLSAEPWVSECHLLGSMISTPAGQSLSRIFFFPGFTPGTGGLLREHDLLEHHDAWQQDEARLRRTLLQEIGAPELSPDALLISLFTYESASLGSWLEALSVGPAPVCCLVPAGRVLAGVAANLGRAGLEPGDVLLRGALTVVVIPFLSQDGYDQLLSVCDFNLVRGEDSFVRAQWAARPLLWHIYPQQEEAHLAKLQAFLDLYVGTPDDGRHVSDSSLTSLIRFWQAWNRGEDCGDLWHHLRPQLPSLREHARKWQRNLAKMPDLAANLLRLQQHLQHEQHAQPRRQ